MSLCWYEGHGDTKHKLANWPDFDADAGRELCKQRKKSAGADPKSTISIKSFVDEAYTPAYALEHKNTKHLDTLKPFRRPVWRSRAHRDQSGTVGRIPDRTQARRHQGVDDQSQPGRSRCVALVRGSQKYLDRHPLRGIPRLKVEQENRVRYLTDAEENAAKGRARRARDEAARGTHLGEQVARERAYELLEDLSNLPYADHIKPMVLLSLNTGLRQGELFSLLWADVVNDAVITVQSGKAKSRRTVTFRSTGSARGRDVHGASQTGGAGYVFASVTVNRSTT